jgi:hypothetical protein
MRARPGVEPRVGATGAIRLSDGRVARVRILEWALDGFVIEDEDLARAVAGGHVITIALELPDAHLHLVQGASTFWSSSPDVELDHDTSLPEGAENGPVPKWHAKSQRSWPRVKAEPIPFVGQGLLGDRILYVFRSLHGLVLIHAVNRSEQDVEDHYDGEQG